MARLTYRDYLKKNGIPLRYDFKTDEGMENYRDSMVEYYKTIYDDLKLREEDFILEIGCHYGAFVKYLNQRKIIPDAIDNDTKKIELLKNDKNLKANFICGDAGQFLENKKEHYDYVFMNFVLEHIPRDSYLILLKNIQKSLKFRGKLVVTVPNMENPFNLRLRYCEPTHINGFTTESLIWAFYMSGFDDIICQDAKNYEEEKYKQIKAYFENISELMEIRKFHNKFSESLICYGTKIYDLKDIELGPYDY